MIRVIAAVVFLLFSSSVASAQSFAAGLHLSSAQWSEFDGSDMGIGGRITWRPAPMLGLDADVTVYPADFPPDTAAAFSNAHRLEGLFGATVGPRLNRVRPFAKAAVGFLEVDNNAAAFACIAIFPPPLACVLAGGATLATYEIGGGVEVDTPARTFIRVDIAQRLVKYPGPTFRNGLEDRVDDDFLGGALHFTIGAGVRF
jgi:hypothetical protein